MRAARRKSLAPSWIAPGSCISRGCRIRFLAKTQREPQRAQRRKGMNENEVARDIVDAAYRVHTTLGPGLLESVYEAALAYELDKRGLKAGRQRVVAAVYEGITIHTAFYADLIVEDNVTVE